MKAAFVPELSERAGFDVANCFAAYAAVCVSDLRKRRLLSVAPVVFRRSHRREPRCSPSSRGPARTSARSFRSASPRDRCERWGRSRGSSEAVLGRRRGRCSARRPPGLPGPLVRPTTFAAPPLRARATHRSRECQRPRRAPRSARGGRRDRARVDLGRGSRGNRRKRRKCCGVSTSGRGARRECPRASRSRRGNAR